MSCGASDVRGKADKSGNNKKAGLESYRFFITAILPTTFVTIERENNGTKKLCKQNVIPIPRRLNKSRNNGKGVKGAAFRASRSFFGISTAANQHRTERKHYNSP